MFKFKSGTSDDSGAENDYGAARLFFALWPDEGLSAALYRLGGQLHEHCGGRRLQAETLHLTLAFLGKVEQSRAADVHALASLIEAAPFDVILLQTGFWQHNRIAWAAPAEMPQGLAELAGALQKRLTAVGFKLDARPYRPHVSLLRNALCTPLPALAEALHWPVRDFVLARSVKAGNVPTYQLIGRWPLSLWP